MSVVLTRNDLVKIFQREFSSSKCHANFHVLSVFKNNRLQVIICFLEARLPNQNMMNIACGGTNIH